MPRVDFDLDDPLQRDFLSGWTGQEPEGPVHLVPGSEAFVRAIGLGLGWGLVPEPQAEAALAAGPLVLLSASRHVDVQLHWQEWDLAPAPVHAFGEWLRGFAAARLRRG